MAYKCSFLDSEIYSAQDVNDIFARITSGGVVFTDTGYTFGDLNTAQSEMVSGGVTKDINACRVVKSGDVYKISKGFCFMNDGSSITFDEDGQEIEIIPGVLNYVYLVRNVVANSIDIIVSEVAGGEDSIPLAEITASGEILDRRKYAKAKVNLALYGSTRDFTVIFDKCGGNLSETVTIDCGDGAFSHIILWGGRMTYYTNSQNRESHGKNIIPLIEGEEVTMAIGRATGDETELAYYKKDGQKIHIYLLKAIANAKYTLNIGVI